MEEGLEGLYFRLGRKAVAQAGRIRKAFEERGLPFLIESPSNQQFPILTKAQLAHLNAFTFSPWETLPDGREAVRVCTSWATREEDVDALIETIATLPRA